MVHEIVRHEDGKLGLKAPEPLDEYFTVDKPVNAAALKGDVEISGNSITLSSQPGDYALADMGTRPATMTLECDVKMEMDGRVGFAFGGSAADETWTALCLDAKQNLLHYEGLEIEDLGSYDAQALTKFDFNRTDTHHVKLVCENEIVVMYVDDVKALGSRISHSINGAHIGVFTDGCGATFSNIEMKLPG